MNIGVALKALRKSRKLSQAELADKVGIRQSYMSQIEKGHREPSMTLVQAIGDYYKIPVSIMLWVATREEDVPPEKREAFRQIKPLVDSLVTQLF